MPSASPAIELDAADYPVVRIAPQRAPNDHEVKHFTDTLEALIAQHDRPFAVVLDARGKARLSKAQQGMVAKAFKSGAIARHVRGEAVVFRSRLIVWFGRVFLAIKRTDIPMATFSELSDANAWARARAS